MDQQPLLKVATVRPLPAAAVAGQCVGQNCAVQTGVEQAKNSIRSEQTASTSSLSYLLVHPLRLGFFLVALYYYFCLRSSLAHYSSSHRVIPGYFVHIKLQVWCRLDLLFSEEFPLSPQRSKYVCTHNQTDIIIQPGTVLTSFVSLHSYQDAVHSCQGSPVHRIHRGQHRLCCGDRGSKIQMLCFGGMLQRYL